MMKYLLLLMLVLATCWASNPLFEKVEPESLQPVPGNYRLPDNVVPINYKIELTPYLDIKDEQNFTFDGYSVITLEIRKPTKTITFHAKQLKFNNINLTFKRILNPPPKDVIDLKPDINEENDFVTLTLENEIDPDPSLVAELHIKFTGKLNDELRGFYRSSYQEGNDKRWLATTHFEPVGARQAFPCWDEPAIKATFDITIDVHNVPDNYHALSNMPENENKNGKITFLQTQKMSTYLVAFVVSDYAKKENEEKNFRVWTKPNAINSSTGFAFEIGNKTLHKLKEFTGIDYYNPEAKNPKPKIKMDQISIPDFVAGAMENWGLVTYRESGLLYTPNKSTTEDRQSIATVIVHEFAHQWFGNLVTCDWWDNIWLNEGFATFFQYYITGQIVQELYEEKSWRLMEQFVIKNLQASAFVVDATTKTRSLNSEVTAKTSDQIHSLFDDIAYKKGASILRMLQQITTKELFQNGLKQYLNDNKYSSVTSDKLFKAIKDADKKNKILEKNLPKSLDEVMDNWLKKPGYPVVTVTRNTTLKVNLTQERFFLVKQLKQDTTQWYVPITYVTEEDPVTVKPEKPEWLKPGEVLTIDNLNNTKWVLFNKDQTGYYRVNYDVENWNLLAAFLLTPNFTNISASNRAQLIDDALNLARAGYSGYDSALNITKYLKQETDYIPWYAAVRAFNYLDGLLRGTENYDIFQEYVVQRIQNFTTTVNYTSGKGSHVEKLGKVLALNTACKYGHKDCESFAITELKEWLDNENKRLSPDLKNGIICAALRKENVNTWNKVLDKKYKNNQDKDEQAAILSGLGCATSKEIVDRFLNLSIGEEPITDVFSAMNSIATGNADSFDILLNFITSHIEIISKADEKNTKLPALLNKLAAKVITEEQYVKLSKVVYEHMQDIEKFTGLNTALENLAWINSHRDEVEAWILLNYIVEKDTSSASSFTLATFLVIIPILLARFN